MDFATKGEQPFANLIREQFVNQVPTKPLDSRHPNEGRKALLFSDGRQKAARLASSARPAPRSRARFVSRGADRSSCGLGKLQREGTLDEMLYAAFVSVCARHFFHFFDGQDQTSLIEECHRFGKDYDSDLDIALQDGWRPQPPVRYRQALLRQIGDPYCSLVAACAAVVKPRGAKLRLLGRRVGAVVSPEALDEIAQGWVRECWIIAHLIPACP